MPRRGGSLAPCPTSSAGCRYKRNSRSRSAGTSSPSAVWDTLAAIVDLEAVDVFPELRHAFEDELIDPQFIEPDEFADSAPPANSRRLEELRSSQPPIDDVVEATSWWSDDGEDADDGDAVSGPPQPYRAPPKIGRNEPRPCGSGKKYKKCCGQ